MENTAAVVGEFIEQWGAIFKWKFEGVNPQALWDVVSDFMAPHKWARSIVQTCELADGEANVAGCVRRVTFHPALPDDPPQVAYEKLLDIDHLNHCFSYSLLPGHSLQALISVQQHRGKFRLLSESPSSSCEKDSKMNATESFILEWSFFSSCVPDGYSEVEFIETLFSFYQTIMADFRAILSLPEESISFLCMSSPFAAQNEQ
ncbi:hypothetical protein KP509_34G068000 [Ceratopteris richardii]|uniref:Lachrymatory factor synthase n=1 Tax=Ceratopteris richardii TaxID=49495 RepID=A0A8T2QMJ1_CERRI|nr:hypothetical protein KP509_34G068000 [Ceratopteris richardii]